MRKLSCGRALSRLCISPVTAHTYSSSSSSSSCCSRLCFGNKKYASTRENKPLIPTRADHVNSMKLKDVIAGVPTLAFQLNPKMVVMRVSSMHCNGCARKVEKHISKLEGVTSYQVDLETKMVVVTGDIVPFEVLESVSKVKNAQLWDNQSHT